MKALASVEGRFLRGKKDIRWCNLTLVIVVSSPNEVVCSGLKDPGINGVHTGPSATAAKFHSKKRQDLKRRDAHRIDR
jgi:hypothetical protein